MPCPCKQNQQHLAAPQTVKENKQAPTPIRRVGSVRRLRREIK